jgi:hypothetical protein
LKRKISISDINEQVLVNVYGRNAPDAAKFGVGATTLAQIKQATDARRALSNEHLELHVICAAVGSNFTALDR